MKLNDFKNKDIQVVGPLGAEGSTLALFLIKLGCKNLIGHDFSFAHKKRSTFFYYHPNQSLKKSEKQLKTIISNFKEINYRTNYLRGIGQAEIIFTPYSWFRYPINRPLAKISRRNNFWHWYNLLLEFYPGTLIGVTGTAGKGTTVNLIQSILKSAGKKVWLVGESWQAFDLEKILKSSKKSYAVAELSNRALTFAKFSQKSPKIAVITNITKNHLDDHQGSFKKYIETKKEIARYQTSNDYLILNNLDPQSKKLINFGKAKKIFFSLNNQNKKLIKNKNIIGDHLLSDALAAIKVAKILKIDPSAVIEGIGRFSRREGRMQLIKIHNNIKFINDGASTRPEATTAAIKSFAAGKINLILEGSRYRPDKNQFLSLIKTIKRQRVKNIAISGKISAFLYPLLKRTSANIIKTRNLAESVRIIYKKSRPGEIVLLSPSGESFGEFKDYRQRIKKFNFIVNKLINE